MRKGKLAVGLVIFLCSIVGYQSSSILAHTVQIGINSYEGNYYSAISLQKNQNDSLQMGDSFTKNLTTLIQIGFIATAVIGTGTICYGVAAKKYSFSLSEDPVEKKLHLQREEKMIKLLKEYSNKFDKHTENAIIASSISEYLEQKKADDRAINILKERLAKGEITHREYVKLESLCK